MEALYIVWHNTMLPMLRIFGNKSTTTNLCDSFSSCSFLKVKLKERFLLIQISLLSPRTYWLTMYRIYVRNMALFMGVWLLVMVIYALGNRVTDLEYIWKFSLLPALFLGTLAALFTFLGEKIRVRKGINWIFLLGAVLADQGIKTYLFSLEWESMSFPLIEPVFYMEPTQNTLGSYLWVLLNLKKGSHLLNIILFSLVGLVFFEIWRFYVARKRNSFWINGFIHLFLAGLLANLIDNAFWGGSLDYITIKPFYTFDLKDLYITLCELFLLTELVDNHLLKRLLQMPREDSRRLNREFFRFVRDDFRFRRKKTGQRGPGNNS